MREKIEFPEVNGRKHYSNFLRVLPFLLSISFRRAFPCSYVIWGCKRCQFVPQLRDIVSAHWHEHQPPVISLLADRKTSLITAEQPNVTKTSLHERPIFSTQKQRVTSWAEHHLPTGPPTWQYFLTITYITWNLSPFQKLAGSLFIDDF